MSQFKFVTEMNNLLIMDGPVTKGPQARWQRKGSENNSLSTSLSRSMSSSISKTPSKLNASDMVKRKTPSKTPSKNKSNSSGGTTPNKGAKTPIADRFIPVRNTTNFDLAHYKLDQNETETNSPSHKELQNIMCENLHGGDINTQKILSFRNKPPTAPEGFQNPMRVIYTQSKTPASVKSSNRYIPHAPDRILDAPDIVDDYYLNLMDWSGDNVLAVALGAHVYLWNAATGSIDDLLELPGNDYVCSLSWMQEGSHLAVGTTTGSVMLWDCVKAKKLRSMDGHSARVGALSWNYCVLSSGGRSGQIIHHDVRQRQHAITTLSAHTQEVCGLKWSPDGKYLASGGNDNVLNIWSTIAGSHHTTDQPLHVLTAHQAAVKALAWCPWQPHVLASGGGTADRHIRLWNCNLGAPLNSIDTKSQVCALLWSSNYKELISGHGFANNELIIWKYPSMTRVAELTGHTARVLHLAMSPDGTSVLSAGADETLRLWKCFLKNPTKTKTEKAINEKRSAFKQCIR